MTPDEELMARIQAQDPQAFELLFERYEAAIRSHLLRMVRSDPAAEDLLQESFLRVWTHASQWTGAGSVKSWIYRIATNSALNYIRSQRRRPAVPLEAPAPWAGEEGSTEEETVPAWMADTSALGPEAALEQAERSEQARRLLRELPEEKREVLHLVHELEMSIRDAADELGVSEGTVKSRLHYAKQRLRQEWQGFESEQE